MSGQRGQWMSGLPKEHARGPNGKPLCGAKPRKWGSLFVQNPKETDCAGCKRKLAILPEAAAEEGRLLGYMQGRGAA